MTVRIEHAERAARLELGHRLVDHGAMSPDWLPVFAAVDRALFLPEVMWPFDMASHSSVAVDRAADPDAWYAHADSNVPIITQWDDGRHDGSGPGRASTSSSSAPSIVFSMLQDLDVEDGARVLEIGTGTGWNAGLLAHRLGDAMVTTVEVDAAVAADARAALQRAGLHPEVVCGDGMLGHPAGAPYDRLIATCGLRQLPGAWVGQVRPGGLVVAPWGTNYSHRDAVARLVVAEDGRTASGRFTELVEFMKARSQRFTRAEHAEYLPDGWPGDATESDTCLPAEAFKPFGGFEFAASVCVPQCTLSTDTRGGDRSVWLYGLSDRSWAAAVLRGGEQKHAVFQSGERRLWDEVEAAWRWWDGQGRPDVDRFGLTVRADGAHEVWLDEPGRRVPSVG